LQRVGASKLDGKHRDKTWKRDIPFSDIGSVTLGDEFDRGNVWAVVTIVLTLGKPIKLYRFREGPLALADALKGAIGGKPAGIIAEIN